MFQSPIILGRDHMGAQEAIGAQNIHLNGD
jgi:hypothetical protein